MDDTLLILIGIILCSILAFLILRAFNCWYWKINKRVELLEKQNEMLERIYAKLDEKK